MNDDPLHDQRAEVLSRLHSAAAAGTLAHDIAMSRIRRAEQATTADELDVLVAGLDAGPAPLPVTVEPYPVATAAAPVTADPGSSASSRIVYRAGWRNLVKQGRWKVPAFLAVEPGYSNVVLDFMMATCDTSVIDILIRESYGWTKLIVPRGWWVTAHDLSLGTGHLGHHVGDEDAEPGQPRLVVHGSLGFGYCTIRHQKPRDRRRLERYLAKNRAELEA